MSDRASDALAKPESGPLMGLAEVAELLGVTKRTATTYAGREDFPAPVQRLAATPVWQRDDVQAWADAHLPLPRGRPPGDNRE